ncbi:MAG: bacillithiol system redox-active protein YtxJ [Pyrinomonadaceae bacterium]
MSAKFKEIYTSEVLKQLFDESHHKPIVFFKHSITCPISRNVFSEVSKIDTDIWVMVVQDARKISNELAEKTGIRHESPQAIVIHKGEVIYHSSHYDITAADVENALSSEIVRI